MKYSCVFVMLLFTPLLFSQAKNISTLSLYDFLDSRIIYEDNGQDVYGYFLLYQKDQVNQNVFDLEFVLLDKNLNKVASDSFQQVRFNVFSIRGSTGIYYAQKIGDKLYLSIGEAYTQTRGIASDLGVISLRILGLNDYKMSDAFLLKDNSSVANKNNVIDEFAGNYFMKPTKNNGFIVFDEPAISSYRRTLTNSMESLKRLQRLTFFDFNMQARWSKDYNEVQSDASFLVYRYHAGDKNDLVLKKYKFMTGVDKNPIQSYEVVDATDGATKFELPSSKDQYLLDVVDIKFEIDQIIFYAALNEFNPDKIFKQGSITGYLKLVFDRKSGKELSADYFLWNSLADKYKIDRYGMIEDYGFLHFHDFETLKNGQSLVVAEAFQSRNITLVLDLFIFVFDEHMKIKDFIKVDKFKNSLYLKNTNGKNLAASGAFDYLYNQNLKGDDFIFYYTDNEKQLKEPTLNSKWVMGAITYIDGVFGFEKISLKGQHGNIYPVKAKNGYVLLKEGSVEGTMLRLEKINY